MSAESDRNPDEALPRGPSVFPAPIYRENVLERVFADAKRFFLEPLVEIEYAHTLMLARTGILPAGEAARCLQALDGMDRQAIRDAVFDGSFEDLFFLVEARLAEVCGAETAGKMHTARSRNDIDLTMYRMVLRGTLLDAATALLTLRERLLDLAWRHRAALMPAYTHNQPAQPTTLGHYLMAFVEVLERDGERLQAAWARVNRNPLGACAITTTGFPIDRHMTAALLGFDGLQVNSYGAIAAVDYVTESCSVLAVAMVSLGRFAQDLLLWSTAELRYLSLSDAYVQVSSIMPQKRNPVPLEHVRVLASRALTQAQGVLGSLHNTPFADMNDAEDDLQPMVYMAFEDAMRSIRLLTGVLGEATFHTARMEAAADAHFLSVTELADTLVRVAGMSFHAAHQVVSAAVKEMIARGAGFDPTEMASIVERELEALHRSTTAVTRAQILAALDAENFVAVRTVPGGPAPTALEPEIARAREQVATDRASLIDRNERLCAAHVNLHREVAAFILAEHS